MKAPRSAGAQNAERRVLNNYSDLKNKNKTETQKYDGTINNSFCTK